jgi:hypothetical protein
VPGGTKEVDTLGLITVQQLLEWEIGVKLSEEQLMMCRVVHAVSNCQNGKCE